MNALQLVATGLAGSTSLTGVHQSLRNKKSTPRVDLLGQQALRKIFGIQSNKKEKETYWGSLAGDLLFNTAYYSIVAKSKRPVMTGTFLGLGAGIMALLAPNFMNLDKKNVKKDSKQKWITVGYYTLGGVVAGLVAHAVRK